MRTRLISRNRFRLPTLAGAHRHAADGAGSLVMERKMLRGIKQRADDSLENQFEARPSQRRGEVAGGTSATH